MRRSGTEPSSITHRIGIARAHTMEDEEGLVPEESSKRSNPQEEEPSVLGTFGGVFAPVTLSMFSSLLFLRVGYIVGNAGVYSLVILVFAYLILASTILSICAIATNGAVKGGGVYFMISRTLGPELGGAIGVLFWAANTVGSALYSTAFTESIFNSFGPEGIIYQLIPEDGYWERFGISCCIVFLVTVICLIGASVFGKFTILFLVLVTACGLSVIVSFFSFHTKRNFTVLYNDTSVAGCTVNCSYISSEGRFVGLWSKSKDSEGFISVFDDGLGPECGRDCQDRDNPVSLFTVFAVLFSGVTGILAGANMSGELKNPSKSIPLGTLTATFSTFLIYVAIFVMTGLTCNRALLYHDCFYMFQLDYYGPLVSLGTSCATFCACLSCLIGASRVISYVGKDEMFGSKFKGVLDLRKSVLITSLIVFLLLFYNSLNSIAQLCSVLYLLSYTAINAACFFLDAFKSPNFRPTFKFFHSSISFFGLVSCAISMFLISYSYAIFSCFLCSLITLTLAYLSPAVANNNWGSIVQNLYLHQVRKYLLKLDPRKEHVKYWRPHILLLVSNPRYSCNLIRFVNAMKKGGLYVLGNVRVHSNDDISEDSLDVDTWAWLEMIDHLKVKAFAEVTTASTLREGIRHLVRISGLGALKPNTVVLGFHTGEGHRKDCSGVSSLGGYNWFPVEEDVEDSTMAENPEDGVLQYVSIVHDVLRLRKSVCIARNFEHMEELESSTAITGILGQMARALTTARSTGDVSDHPNGRRRKHLDIWLTNFFEKPDDIVKDRRFLFMIQMGYIVSISAQFKGTLKLRVIVRDVDSQERTLDLMKSLSVLLKEVRIRAEQVHVPFDHQLTDQIAADDDGSFPNQAYMDHCNRTIKSVTSNTALTFLYLPAPSELLPPGDGVGKSAAALRETYLRYWDLLKTLTEDLPPTVLIHGLHAVTCTAL